jgi:hypothetical protein
MKGRIAPMGTDLNAEILAQIARRQQLIERSKKVIVISKALVEQSDRLIRIAMGHDVDGEVVRTREMSLKSRGSNLE